MKRQLLPEKIFNAINEMSKEYDNKKDYIFFATKLAELDYSDGIDEYDGDDVRCVSCDFKSCISVDEETAYVQ